MSLVDFHFIRPYWLLALIPFLGVFSLLLKNKLSAGNWSSVCDAELLPYLLQDKAVNDSRWTLTTGAMASLLVIIALAGPTWKRLPSPVFRNDSALVIALSLAPSMDAEDIKPSRLIRARYKISDILAQRKDGQTALLVYAGDAFTVTPLTDDTETIESQLEALTTSIMPTEGNNAGSAIRKALELFKQAGLQKGQILLVTDSVNEDDTSNAINDLEGYELSVLGVGTEDGAPIALTEGGFLKDEQGRIQVPKLNIAALKSLAQAGKGHYQTITADDADVKKLITAIDQPVQQQTDQENKNILLEQWDDKGPWLLVLALPFVVLSFRKGLLGIALLVLLPLPKNSYAFEWQDLWHNKNQQAQQAFEHKNFDQAARLFDSSDWKAVALYKAGKYDEASEQLKKDQTALGAYNQGNALAQAGHLEEAVKAYEKALASNPNDADAKYNKELVEKELEKQKQEKEQQKQDNKEKQDKQEKQEKQEKKDKQNGESKDDQQSQQDQEKSAEQKESEQKPQQSEEKKTQQQQADEQKSEQSQASKEEEQKAAEEAKAKEAKQAEKPEEPKEPKDEKAKSSAAQVKEEPMTEEQQANEQWLKRIPDDPAGLLKRKFKYQYSQRHHLNN